MFRIGGQRRVFQPDRYMPGPTSLLCLGCHDGTIATSTMGTSHALLAGIREGFRVPDGFVWRDHPIGVLYPQGRLDYHPQAFVEKQGIRLPEGRMECISCHDPHNTCDIDALLVMSNRRSALCLTCHIK
jgi:predicted CXXCH cytochrome family protein